MRYIPTNVQFEELEIVIECTFGNQIISKGMKPKEAGYSWGVRKKAGSLPKRITVVFHHISNFQVAFGGGSKHLSVVMEGMCGLVDCGIIEGVRVLLKDGVWVGDI